MRRHHLGGRVVCWTTPWVSAYMTADMVKAIADFDLPTINIHASGPRGPFEAILHPDKERAWGRTVLIAVANLASLMKVAAPTESELRALAGDR